MNRLIFKLSLLIIIILIGYHSVSAEQTRKKINNKEYVIDTTKGKVYQSNKGDLKGFSSSGDLFEVNENSIVKNTFIKVLSKERITALKNKSLIVKLGCLPDGQVCNVIFFFSNEVFLTPEEIEKIETDLLSQKFLLSWNTKERRNVTFNYGVFMNRLLK